MSTVGNTYLSLPLEKLTFTAVDIVGLGPWELAVALGYKLSNGLTKAG